MLIKPVIEMYIVSKMYILVIYIYLSLMFYIKFVT